MLVAVATRPKTPEFCPNGHRNLLPQLKRLAVRDRYSIILTIQYTEGPIDTFLCIDWSGDYAIIAVTTLIQYHITVPICFVERVVQNKIALRRGNLSRSQ